jgi:alpha-beta hydrolase superfamily lysophospholipase
VDNLEPLAKAGIPIIHVVGQADTLVPVQDNTDIVEKRYQELGGTIEVIRKPGVEHHPHSLPNPEPIVDFILSHQK